MVGCKMNLPMGWSKDRINRFNHDVIHFGKKGEEFDLIRDICKWIYSGIVSGNRRDSALTLWRFGQVGASWIRYRHRVTNKGFKRFMDMIFNLDFLPL